MAAIEFWSAWRMRDGSWESAVTALAGFSEGDRAVATAQRRRNCRSAVVRSRSGWAGRQSPDSLRARASPLTAYTGVGHGSVGPARAGNRIARRARHRQRASEVRCEVRPGNGTPSGLIASTSVAGRDVDSATRCVDGARTGILSYACCGDCGGDSVKSLGGRGGERRNLNGVATEDAAAQGDGRTSKEPQTAMSTSLDGSPRVESPGETVRDVPNELPGLSAGKAGTAWFPPPPAASATVGVPTPSMAPSTSTSSTRWPEK